MVKVCLRGRCKNIEPATKNGKTARCRIGLQLHDGISFQDARDVELLIPAEYAALLEVGLSLTLTLEQNEN